MLVGSQQTCPVLIMTHGPLTAGKHRDYLNQDKLKSSVYTSQHLVQTAHVH